MRKELREESVVICFFAGMSAVDLIAGALAAALATACAAAHTQAPRLDQEEPLPAPWVELFDGVSLEGWELTRFGGEGEVRVEDDGIVLGFGSPLTGIHLAAETRLPTVDYELEVTAARLSGTDFFCGLTFPVTATHATLILGGWGGALTGLSCLDGEDASRNETRSFRSYTKGRDYTARVRVTAGRIQAWLDGELLFDASTEGRTVEVRTEVLASRPLGVASFATVARVRSIRLRKL